MTSCSNPALRSALSALLVLGALALALTSGQARAGCADLHGERVVAHGGSIEIDGQRWHLNSRSGEEAFMNELLDCDETTAARHLTAWRSRRHRAQVLSVVGLITPFWVVSFPAFEIAALATGSRGHQERELLVESLRGARSTDLDLEDDDTADDE